MSEMRERSSSKAVPVAHANPLLEISQRRTASTAAGLMRQDYREETRKVWSRPIDRLPIAIDLPRLAAHVHVLTGDAVPASPAAAPPSSAVSSPGPESPAVSPAPATSPAPDAVQPVVRITAYEQVLRVLMEIAKELEGPERAEVIRQAYENMIVKEADMSIQKAAINNLLMNTVGADSKSAAVLKAVNQSIVAPSAIELRMFMLPGLQMKDSQKRPWEVTVSLSRDHVCVSHLRRQMHFDSRQPEGAFEFTWEIVLEFDPDLTRIDKVNLWLLGYTFGPNTSEDKRRELTAVFEPLVSKCAEDRRALYQLSS